MASLIRVGENLNVMSTAAGTAMKERDAAAIKEMARREAEQGVDLIDINIGPARKDGRELMPWLVETIQEATDVRLSLDTTNLEAMEAGIKTCRRPPLMNSISLQTSRFGPGLDLAARTGADCIALLWSDAGMPRDANERAMLLVDFMQKAAEAGVPMDRVWIDPIVTPVSVETSQLRACLEFIAMVKDIAPEARTICGLSNVSSGVPAHLRHWLNRTYLIMLMRQGLSAAIVDAFDEVIPSIASGRPDTAVRLVHRMMDGEEIDGATLSEEEAKYAKTVRVLTGESVFSHSWLDI
ncbi:MAG TPA: dihydropteroate synthase [Spirochaetota bacterium]|nr:dihydropteroate synthase [Spirochaetota bacterium]HOD14474.1 dihydropteroate synthase [Spirochaetota bacterium]HPG52480.1 dihydropteroate synthase [Spirochaetota bacterium]HPN13462.1 dihydropteroate synthase [Spirochaetota bacterium]HQL81060.1 dihydropteroate synthase [Spirochaetota bacterium]